MRGKEKYFKIISSKLKDKTDFEVVDDYGFTKVNIRFPFCEDWCSHVNFLLNETSIKEFIGMKVDTMYGINPSDFLIFYEYYYRPFIMDKLLLIGI